MLRCKRYLVFRNIIRQHFTYVYAPQFYKENSKFKNHYKLIPKATLALNSIRALQQSL